MKSVIILGGMVAHISSPMSALQRHVRYTLACVDELMESEQRLLSPCSLRCDARTTFCHVKACNNSPMHSYDISKHACQCDTAWSLMQSRSLDRHVLQASTYVAAKRIQISIATNTAPWRENVASSSPLLTRPRQKWQATHHTQTGLSLFVINPRNWFRLLPFF